MKDYLLPAIAGVLVFALGVLAVRLLPRISGQSLQETANWTGVAVNVMVLFVGVFSLLVAGAAYQSAQRSGEAQTKVLIEQRSVLEDSKNALASVTKQLDDQRQLLDKTLETSSSHLQLVQQAYEQEERRLSLKPRLRISIAQLTEDQLNEVIPVTPDENGWLPIEFRIFNEGDADLNDPVLVVAASPSTIAVTQRGFRVIAGRPRRNVLQVASSIPARRAALMVEGAALRHDVEVQVPSDGPREFELELRIFGDDFPDVQRRFRFRALPREGR